MTGCQPAAPRALKPSKPTLWDSSHCMFQTAQPIATHFSHILRVRGLFSSITPPTYAIAFLMTSSTCAILLGMMSSRRPWFPFPFLPTGGDPPDKLKPLKHLLLSY